MNTIHEQIEEIGIIPVIKLENAKHAERLADLLVEGGLPVAEITFRTDAAEEAICKMKKRHPNMLVGAGTVLTVEQIVRARDAGSSFIVTPGFNRTTSEYCILHGIPVFPGCNSTMALEAALEMGLTHLKFFPAEASGGLKMIDSLAAPYSAVRFMPTGGITPQNVGDYLSHKSVFACGGSWMVKDGFAEDEISEERFQKTASLIKGVPALALGVKLKETANEEIIFVVHSLKRLISHLARQGLLFEVKFKEKERNSILAVYLKEKLNGKCIKFVC